MVAALSPKLALRYAAQLVIEQREQCVGGRIIAAGQVNEECRHARPHGLVNRWRVLEHAQRSGMVNTGQSGFASFRWIRAASIPGIGFKPTV